MTRWGNVAPCYFTGVVSGEIIAKLRLQGRNDLKYSIKPFTSLWRLSELHTRVAAHHYITLQENHSNQRLFLKPSRQLSRSHAHWLRGGRVTHVEAASLGQSKHITASLQLRTKTASLTRLSARSLKLPQLILL